MDERMVVEIVEGTWGQGGYVTFGAAEGGAPRVEWWHPKLACPAWTIGPNMTLEDALREAAERVRRLNG